MVQGKQSSSSNIDRTKVCVTAICAHGCAFVVGAFIRGKILSRSVYFKSGVRGVHIHVLYLLINRKPLHFFVHTAEHFTAGWGQVASFYLLLMCLESIHFEGFCYL